MTKKIAYITPRIDFSDNQQLSLLHQETDSGVLDDQVVLIGRGNENDKKLIEDAEKNRYPVVVFQPVNKIVPSLPHDVSYFIYKVKQLIRQADHVVVFRHEDSADTKIAVEFAGKLNKPLTIYDLN